MKQENRYWLDIEPADDEIKIVPECVAVAIIVLGFVAYEIYSYWKVVG